MIIWIDAPEMNYCKKVKNNEKELQMPAALLIKLGYMSLEFLKANVGLDEMCTLIQEENNTLDKYGRYLVI